MQAIKHLLINIDSTSWKRDGYIFIFQMLHDLFGRKEKQMAKTKKT